MNPLAKLQQTFQNCVLKPEQSFSTHWISAKGRASPETQLSIYSYAYHSRLSEVLSNDYPAIVNAVGEDYFNKRCDEYIEAHPSQFFSLRDFGALFADFISAFIEKNKQQDMRWLYELALFEWQLGIAFDAADDNIFTEQDMARISPEDWPQLTFSLHASVHCLQFEWNTVEMWQTLTADEPGRITANNEESSSWLIWRDQLTTRFRSLQKDEQNAFNELQKGGAFSDICESLTPLMNEDKIPMHVASLLKGWITQGLISSVQ